MFPIRSGLKEADALSPFFFQLCFRICVMRVQLNEDGLKLKGAHQLLAYADDVNILGGSVHTRKTQKLS